jgi:hypothetical protein
MIDELHITVYPAWVYWLVERIDDALEIRTASKMGTFAYRDQGVRRKNRSGGMGSSHTRKEIAQES